MRSLFVAGTHTDVGKTYVACALIAAARARGLAVDALKPLVSGLDPDAWAGSDPGRLLAALGRPLDQGELAAICPWRFRAALAPPMAALREGRAIDLSQVADHGRRWLAASLADLALIEGVGGVMSPLSRTGTGLDLIAALEIPTLLVAGSYLGAVSHALTAVEALRARRLPLLGVVVSQDAAADAPDFGETVAMIAQFLPALPVLAARRDSDTAWAAEVLDLTLSAR